ncbi:hypothetical protein BYT27DRAFT_7075072 [Phlegmacium glaucopus]|nr:hypothetical protein BYT27DRAFT_7075072 [Phlegmacium glaucopus]
MFRRRNKLVRDWEPGCTFKPDSKDNGLIIGDAKEGRSYFRITMWTAFPDESEKIFFSVDFMPIDHSRFETAIFSVSFEEIEIRDGSVNLKDEPIRIRDVFPASKDGMSEKALLEEGMLIHAKAEDDASLSTTAYSTTQNVSTTDIHGIGIYSSTARWTFSQDVTLEPKRGLDASNTVFLVLPRKTEMVLMKFWAEAVLLRKGGSRVHLKIGSEHDCYERILDI